MILCPWFKCESGLKKTDMHVVKQRAFYCRTHMQKSGEALAYARKSIWKSIKNKQWTYCISFMSKTCTIVWFFCFVLIRNFKPFCSFFISVTGLKTFTTILIPGTTVIKNSSSFSPSRLFRATRPFGREE